MNQGLAQYFNGDGAGQNNRFVGCHTYATEEGMKVVAVLEMCLK